MIAYNYYPMTQIAFEQLESSPRVNANHTSHVGGLMMEGVKSQLPVLPTVFFSKIPVNQSFAIPTENA